LERISKNEMTYLIIRNILRQTHGSYGDNLVVIGKFSSKLRKQRYITDPLYNYLIRLKQNDKDKQNINEVKENQKYLFNSNGNSECVS